MDLKAASAVLVVATLAFGASTGYLLVSPAHIATSTLITTQTVTFSSGIASPYSANIAYNSSIGFYLVNGSGFTLYYRNTDVRSTGTSTCTGGCIKAWPAFYASKLSLPPGLDASSFNVVTRADGSKQLTFNGWPLYTFSDDEQPGSVDGQGLGGIWFVYALGGSASTISSTSSSATATATSSASMSTTTATTMSTTTHTTSTTSVTIATTTTTTTTTTTSSSSCYYYCP